MSSGRTSRRHLLQQLALAGLTAGALVQTRVSRASGALLPLSGSLVQELVLAQQLHQPLVVMVSLQGCPFCDVVRNSHLAPMLRREGLPVTQVDMRSEAMTESFAGMPISHDHLVRSWNVTVAPTVLFFGKGGVEIADRLEGGYLPDFYGSYLDDRLFAARRRI